MVWVVTEDGWHRGYGVNIYLVGVFDDPDIANSVAAISEYRKVTEIPLNVAHTLKKDIVDHSYYNDYYLGGYCE